MKDQLFSEIAHQQQISIYPVLSDSHSYIISQLSCHNNKLLFITNDENKLESISQQLSFFKPNLKTIIFPGWDCSPYDKVSPNIINLNQRIHALYSLINKASEPIVILTTIGALTQKLPPKEILANLSKTIKIGDIIAREDLLNFLVALSFRRVEIASEPGDFAVRGDIIDIVSNEDQGWRLDFFSNKLENIRLFNPITQISYGKTENITILPSNEVILNSQSIDNFCKNFQDNFGSLAKDHPLYEAIEGGRKYPGMEHFLPCFYQKLDSIFDYFEPEQILCDNNFVNDLEQRMALIEEYYKDRQHMQVNRFKDEVIYYPLKPNQLWLNFNETKDLLNKYKNIQCYNFATDLPGIKDLTIKKIDNFDQLSSSQNISAFELLKKYRDENKKKIVIACSGDGSYQRMKNILDNHNIHYYRLDQFEDYKKITGKTIGITILPIINGYTMNDFAIISEQDLLGEKIIRKKSKKTLEHLLSEINNLQIGEYIVHKQHGIGLFAGLETITVLNISRDYLKITYDANDILYIPVENLDLLTRYGSSEDSVKLDKLGGSSWVNRKERLKAKLKDIAGELIRIAALRASKEGEHLIAQPHAYEEFCARFPYVETDDQLNSIADVEVDLASGIPMDRLICGDVGFGKTEVAVRAAFIATHPEHNIKQQVAIIVPTTLLARQHYHHFIKRFSGFPVKIAQLSRLVNAKDSKQIKDNLKNGDIDIVIGTHAVLANNMEFKNLGLLIVDEEQHFGVTQKEKLKKIKENIHVLTLSATPIPRTLQMSLTGVRDLSIIATPPIDRQVVKTYIMSYDSVVMREAILREFYRGGQVFFVCPRISDLNEVHSKLLELVPEIKIIVAHGQMNPNQLEEIMSDFYNKKFDLLLSTSIIESGIDIPEANTIFIHRADRFGLSALYQLRGRVGRSNIRAFAYLLLPKQKLSKLATARLEVMQTLDTLGAGFTVASHDMDIRGFGNLVGDEQSGHIREVGLELYQEMLQEAIFNLKNKSNEEEMQHDEYSPQINIGIPVLLPEHYIADLNLRLSLYRNLAALKSIQDVESFAAEMIDRFGIYPIEVEYLLSVIKLKIMAKNIHIDKIDAGPKAITFSFRDNKCLYPEQLLEFITKNQLWIKIRPDQKILINREFQDIKKKIKFLEELLTQLDFKL